MNFYRKRKWFARFVVLTFFLFLLGGAIVVFGIDQPHKVSFLLANPNGSSAMPNIEPALPPNKVFKIMIDPGHGGTDPGTTGVSGIDEKDMTLSLAHKVYELLKKEPMFEPRLTRIDDTLVQLEDRAKLANEQKADALISIHGNSYKDQTVSGTETYYRYDNSLRLAQTIHQNVVEAMGFHDRGVRFRKLKVLTFSTVPAILLEIGYLTNSDEEAVILSNNGQTLAAQAITDGLKQYFSELQK